MMWEFKKLEAGMIERQSHSSEFFNEEARPEAFVREFIQNSLDARRKDSKIVNVSFTFDRVKTDILNLYLSGLTPHLIKCDIKSHFSPERRVLVAEDFGTKGLSGKISFKHVEGSNFYDFWWREGVSSKTGKAGKWGIGKVTFPCASEIKSFWGYTVRFDDNIELIMGRALLKPHTLNSERFLDYSTFSQNDTPITEKAIISKFKTDFAITRKNEPGFSLIIPMPQKEIDFNSVIKYVILHYFFPILKGDLKICVTDKSSGSRIEINQDSIHQIAINIDWTDTQWSDQDIAEILNFGKNAIDIEDMSLIKLLATVAEDYRIFKESFGDYLGKAKERFNSGKILGIMIPVLIESTDGKTNKSHYNVFLKKYSPEELKKSDEYCIRSGIYLPQEHHLGNQTVRAIVLAEDNETFPNVSSFLCDSEEPAHIKWNANTEGFRERYKNASLVLNFIKKSVVSLVQILNIEEDEVHKDLLENFFFVEDQTEKLSKKGKATTTNAEVVTPPPKPKLFEINQVNGGFKVKFIGESENLPLTSTIRIAYNIHRGNAFKNYVPLDFDLTDNEKIKIEESKCRILNLGPNFIEFIPEMGSILEVTGFDKKRDLTIDLKVKKK
jgi:hypothetical protein